MHIEKHESVPITADDDIVRVRQRVRDWAISLGFSLVDQTKLVTAASELARNTLIYGRGGTVTLESVVNERKRGLRLTFEDRGPGIADIALALKDGYTTGNGLGLGLSGARRLSHDFSIDSKVGEGTRIVIARWN
jgi:serine/threonine-protein kinase RsbT